MFFSEFKLELSQEQDTEEVCDGVGDKVGKRIDDPDEEQVELLRCCKQS